MLGAELGDFDYGIGDVYDILAHSVNFVSEDKGILCTRFWHEILKAGRMFHLLHTDYPVTFGTKGKDRIHRVACMRPRHA